MWRPQASWLSVFCYRCCARHMLCWSCSFGSLGQLPVCCEVMPWLVSVFLFCFYLRGWAWNPGFLSLFLSLPATLAQCTLFFSLCLFLPLRTSYILHTYGSEQTMWDLLTKLKSVQVHSACLCSVGTNMFFKKTATGNIPPGSEKCFWPRHREMECCIRSARLNQADVVWDDYGQRVKRNT